MGSTKFGSNRQITRNGNDHTSIGVHIISPNLWNHFHQNKICSTHYLSRFWLQNRLKYVLHAPLIPFLLRSFVLIQYYSISVPHDGYNSYYTSIGIHTIPQNLRNHQHQPYAYLSRVLLENRLKYALQDPHSSSPLALSVLVCSTTVSTGIRVKRQEINGETRSRS